MGWFSKTRAAKWAVGLAVLAALSGCAKAEPKPETGASVTAQELLSRSGISLPVPAQARITKWVVALDRDGQTYPQVNFELDGISWSYGAVHTDRAVPFFFAAAWGNAPVERFSLAELPCAVSVGESGGWCGWIENGVCHNLFTADCTQEELTQLLQTMLSITHPELTEDELPSDSGHLIGSSANLFKGIWKYDDADTWLYIHDNMTYAVCGSDRKADGRVRFCAIDPNDGSTLLLYQYSGGRLLRLTAQELDGTVTLTDPDGRTLSPSTDAMDGTYDCYLGNWSLDGTTDLWLTTIMDLWLSDSNVSELIPGRMLHLEDVAISDIPLETVERVSDTTIVLNGTMKLIYDADAGAWKLTDHDFLWVSWLGNCTLTASTEFIDTLDKEQHKSLRKCFEAHEPVMGYVTVKNGLVTQIEITKLFE